MKAQPWKKLRKWSANREILRWLVVGTLGAVEGIYGRTQYLADWISYLNVSRAVSALEWKDVFNSMWSPGYPLLVALMRRSFPQTPEGEWYAITFLNWLIYLSAYASWRYLIRSAIEFYKPAAVGLRNRPFVVVTTDCIFLSCALGLNQVSSVSPDLLVCTLFVLAAAQTLSLLIQPTVSRSVILGAVLGAGCWVKGVFLAFTLIFLFTIFLVYHRKRIPWKTLWIVTAMYLLIYVPFVAGLSWSYGQFTLGTTGSLNYAFHVNHLPHWTNWQGGPSEFGTPIHPTRQLLQGLPIFEFGAPFHTTYPPYNNLAYWYQGFHHFYSLKLQLAAWGRTLYFLAAIVKANPFLYFLALAWVIVLVKRAWRISMWDKVRRLWLLFLPCLLGLATYLMVHVEDRYLSPFALILGLVPLLPLLDPTLKGRRKLAGLLLPIYILGAAGELKAIDGPTFKAAVDRRDFHQDKQWRIAAALPFMGIRSGDPVAVIHGKDLSYRCHWAYIAHVRIVAEFGALPWTLEPWDRTHFDHSGGELADEDYGVLFWQKLSRQQRQEVIELFRETGARAIIALSKPNAAPETGWQPIPGTDAMIYRFDSR